MTAKVALKNLGECEIPIDLGKDGVFRLVVTPPTIADEISSAMTENVLASRVAQSVVGWKDINGEDGQPIPFSTEALAVLTRQYPGTLGQIVTGVENLYAGPSEEESKNSGGQSSDSTANANVANK